MRAIARVSLIGGMIAVSGTLVGERLAKADGPASSPTTIVAPAPPPNPEAGAPPPAPYSLPWQLRPAAIGTVLRSDTSVAFYKLKNMAGGEDAGSTVASTFLASYKVHKNFAPFVRAAVVQNDDPGSTLDSGTAFCNPLLGGAYGTKFGPDFRFSAILGATLPVGSGGDKKRTVDETAAAPPRGIFARSAMDNALFAINYFVVISGADLAFVKKKWTIQAEVSALQLTRVRNEDIDADSSRTNFTTGLHVGYFAFPFMSLGTEVRYQRWLSTPAAVKMNSALRDNVTVALGPRFHFKVADKTWLRPGISYTRAFDDPMSDAAYNIVQVDVPVAF